MFTASSASDRSHALRVLWSWLCGACILLSAASGCRTARDNQIDILERELRTQEDYIYELEDYVVQYSEKLRQCRCSMPMTVDSESSPTKSVLKKSKAAKAEVERSQPLPEDEEPLLEPGDEIPDEQPPVTPEEEMSPKEIEIPELEIGEPVSQVENDACVQPAAYPSTAPRLAEQLVITHLFRNEPVEESRRSLLAVVEALDAHDEPVEVDGEVSLMVMTADGKKPLRLKRWDFTPEDAATAWQSSNLGDGLHLELPLEETELPDVPLELWVRLVNADGSKLLTQLPFQRESLTALEPETGARELAPSGGEKIAQQDADQGARNAEGRLLSAEEPVSDAEDSQSDWKPALVRSDSTPSGDSAATAKSSGWTPQPPGGRFPELQPAQESTTDSRQPVWTAGRVGQTPLGRTRRESHPQWSPFR